MCLHFKKHSIYFCNKYIQFNTNKSKIHPFNIVQNSEDIPFSPDGYNFFNGSIYISKFNLVIKLIYNKTDKVIMIQKIKKSYIVDNNMIDLLDTCDTCDKHNNLSNIYLYLTFLNTNYNDQMPRISLYDIIKMKKTINLWTPLSSFPFISNDLYYTIYS